MDTDEKQFSVNRAASKKQILITSLLAVTLALVFGTGEAEAASSAFAATSAGTSEATLDSHSASGTLSANATDSHYADFPGSFSLTNFARASVIGPGIRLFTSASFGGDPVIQSRATASGEWKDTVFFSLDWTLYPDVTGLNPHAIIQISANITALGAAGVGATATLNFTDLDISGGTQTLDVPGTASDFTTQGVSRVFAFAIDFSASLRASAGYLGGTFGSGSVSGDFSQSGINLIGFAPTDTNGNPVAVTITSDSGEIYSFVPTISNASVSNGVASFRFTTTPGRTYRVEYKADLNGPTWAPLGADRVAAGTSITVTDVIGPEPRRFYRVRVVN